MAEPEAEPSLSSTSSASAAAAVRVRSRPDPFLVICRCFSLITIAAALFCIAVNVLSAVRSFQNGSDYYLYGGESAVILNFMVAIMFLVIIEMSTFTVTAIPPRSLIFDGIFRCYAVVIALFVVVAETEWEFVMKFSKVLEYWAGRGMLQIFVAVMTKAYPEDFENRKDLILVQSIASYMLLSCGVIYIVAGLLCIGRFKRARQKKEVSRDQAVRDLQELERRREELEALLLMEERV